jgi:hypothetical protein
VRRAARAVRWGPTTAARILRSGVGCRLPSSKKLAPTLLGSCDSPGLAEQLDREFSPSVHPSSHLCRHPASLLHILASLEASILKRQLRLPISAAFIRVISNFKITTMAPMRAVFRAVPRRAFSASARDVSTFLDPNALFKLCAQLHRSLSPSRLGCN